MKRKSWKPSKKEVFTSEDGKELVLADVAEALEEEEEEDDNTLVCTITASMLFSCNGVPSLEDELVLLRSLDDDMPCGIGNQISKIKHTKKFCQRCNRIISITRIDG